MADRELDDLAKYLLHVAGVEDMETLNHKVSSIVSWGPHCLTDLLGLETSCPCTASSLIVKGQEPCPTVFRISVIPLELIDSFYICFVCYNHDTRYNILFKTCESLDKSLT